MQYFQIKAKSFDEFIGILQRERAKEATAETGYGLETKSSGYRHHYNEETYFNMFRSQTSTGRPIIFKEVYTSKVLFETKFNFRKMSHEHTYHVDDVGHEMEYDNNRRKLIVTAGDRLRKIRERVPGIKTDIINLDDRMDEQAYQQLLTNIAAQYGAVSF